MIAPQKAPSKASTARLEQKHAALEPGDIGLVEGVARLLDEAHVAVDHADLRAVRLEVEEVFRA